MFPAIGVYLKLSSNQSVSNSQNYQMTVANQLLAPQSKSESLCASFAEFRDPKNGKEKQLSQMRITEPMK